MHMYSQRTVCCIRVIIVTYLTHTHNTHSHTHTHTGLCFLISLPIFIVLRFVILTYLCQFRNTILVNQRKRRRKRKKEGELFTSET